MADRAQAAEPIGVPTCDAFVTAYERCAAGIPEATRCAILTGIATLRGTLRDAANSNPQARVSVAKQCVQIHEQTRASLIQAFKCDFPKPVATVANAADDLGTPPPPAAVKPVSPEQREAAKASAYTEVQNGLVEHRSLEKDLFEYQRNNERVVKPGAKPGPEAFFLFGVPDLDRDIERLEAAIALPGTIPDVDEAALQLLAAMRRLNPVIKALDRYQTTREFKEDGFRLAQEQTPLFIAGMRNTIKAADLYADALFERAMARDERRIQAMNRDTLAQRLLATSLSTRRLLRAAQRHQAGDDTGPIATALGDVSASNKALYSVLDALQPRPDSACKGYATTVDSLLGYGRDLLRDLKSRSEAGSTGERFTSYYNNSIDDMAKCQRNEVRARV